MDYFHTARINMVRNQLMPNQVQDEKVLNSMSKVQRHPFVENKLQAFIMQILQMLL